MIGNKIEWKCSNMENQNKDVEKFETKAEGYKGSNLSLVGLGLIIVGVVLFYFYFAKAESYDLNSQYEGIFVIPDIIRAFILYPWFLILLIIGGLALLYIGADKKPKSIENLNDNAQNSEDTQ